MFCRLLPAALALAPSMAHGAPVRSSASANVVLARAPLIGVNLSGCEFIDDGSLCPTPAQIDAYIEKGFRAFRIPFRGRQASDPLVIAKLQVAVAAAVRRDAYVILDRHDYARTFSPAEAGWWRSFIRHFPDTDRVMIDTMNEPRSGAPYERDRATGKSYATEVNAGIAAFRRAGFKHMLLIEWRGWSGMQRFYKGEPAGKACESAACSFDRAGGLKDPIGRTMISGHRYPDRDSSGTTPICHAGSREPYEAGKAMLANADTAAEARGLKIWVGEIAFGNAGALSPVCEQMLKGALARMRSMPHVYAGVTWWGGGAGWRESYLYRIEPGKGTFATAAPSRYLRLLIGG